ncbi:MAG: hypothetical protein GVX78_04980 [Bacteroidetes bacterium]|jgi:hypothetical protein|nr:hypothetical protein [Bacteroidota bacterium]
MKTKALFISLFIFTVFFVNAQGFVYPYSYSDNLKKSYHNKWGLVNSQNQIITEPTYDYIWFFPNQKHNSYTKFRQKNEKGDLKFGLIDKQGEIVVGPQELELYYDGNGVFYYQYAGETLEIREINSGQLVHARDSIQDITGASGIVIIEVLQNRYYYHYAIFKNKSVKKLDVYGGQSPYTIEGRRDGCSILFTEGGTFNCLGEKIEYSDLDIKFTDQRIRESSFDGGGSFSSGTIKDRDFEKKNIVEKRFENETIFPIRKEKEVRGYIIKPNLLVSPTGDTLFYDKKAVLRSLKRKGNSHYRGGPYDQLFIKNGAYFHFTLMSLLNMKGEQLLKPEYKLIEFYDSIYDRLASRNPGFVVISSSDDIHSIQKQINLSGDLLYIVHKSGYGGFYSFDFKVNRLPENCDCLD